MERGRTRRKREKEGQHEEEEQDEEAKGGGAEGRGLPLDAPGGSQYSQDPPPSQSSIADARGDMRVGNWAMSVVRRRAAGA